MENYVIYDNGDIKVEIDGFFHMIAEEIVSPYFRLEPTFTQVLLSKIAQLILSKEMAPLEKTIVCSNKVYLISQYLPTKLQEPFAQFNKGIEVICQAENFQQNKKKIVQKVMELYDSSTFIFEIYDQPLYGVDGYFCDIREDNVYITFFTYIDL